MRKINILVAVLEVEGPDTITIRKGADAGKQVSLLKLILGDEEGGVCKLTAWREVADLWGRNEDLPAVKRGDIVSIESMLASPQSPLYNLPTYKLLHRHISIPISHYSLLNFAHRLLIPPIQTGDMLPHDAVLSRR